MRIKKNCKNRKKCGRLYDMSKAKRTLKRIPINRILD